MTDAYESVCEAESDDVKLVMIARQLSYGRADWMKSLAADPADPVLEAVLAWGRWMLLNTDEPTLGDPGPR